MSKQSEAKAHQGYKEKPEPRTCCACRHFGSDLRLPIWTARAKEDGERHWSGRAYSVELDGAQKNLRCLAGGFAVKKTATCDVFTPKESP